MTKRTKIVATIGPATANLEAIRRLACAGVNVFRLNFSHGSHESHRAVIEAIRAVCVEMRQPFAILADLSGPKLRLQPLASPSVEVTEGDRVELTSDPADGSGMRFGVSFPGLHELVRPGEKILIDDGAIRLTVLGVNGRIVECRADNGGVILPRKGLNLPNTSLPFPALTDKDRADLAFALAHGADLVALSFVRRAEDLRQAREAMNLSGRRVPLLAKIEMREAVENLDEIIAESDGAMVARGDLGIEIPIEQVPAVQKRVIRLCHLQQKPVITATQMLDSMIRNPRPTRAEVTDIFNAITDGSDAVMLSGETAVGSYPIEAVEVMGRVAREAEAALGGSVVKWAALQEWTIESVSEMTALAAVIVAVRIGAECIVAPTWTGATARRVAQLRPPVPVFACSTQTSAVNPLCAVWGVEARIMADVDPEEVRASEADAIVNAALRCAREHGFVRSGMTVVVLAGVPLGMADSTNFLRVIVAD
ncbi:MAG: pyruvate kinase [Candidatus Sumerlaeaceae bacterium]|nr:pyruvate kinase [Candidatus Sumerlaeaceae bacterium]